MTPLGELFLTADEPAGEPEPGDDELGRALLPVWADQIAARLVDPRTLFKGIGGA